MNIRHAFPFFIALAASAFLSSVLHAEYFLTITDLGTLGGRESHASAVNDYGVVVGDAYTTDGVDHAFTYANGVMTDLGTLGGDSSAATGINNQNQIVGWSRTAVSPSRAFVFWKGVMIDLGTLGGNYSSAAAINNHGLIVGAADLTNGIEHAFSFSFSNGMMTDLGTLGGDSSYATAVSDNGEIVGVSDIPSSDRSQFSGGEYTFVYSNGSMQNLNTLGGPAGGLVYASCVNSSGQIAGNETAGLSARGPNGFLTLGGATTYLGDSTLSVSITGLNDYSLVVGTYATLPPAEMVSYPYLYSNGVFYNLNSLIDFSGSGFVQLNDVTAISNTGFIVGDAVAADGNLHGFLLTPITHPSP